MWLRAEFGPIYIVLTLMWQPVNTQFDASLLAFILPQCCVGITVVADYRLHKSLAFLIGQQSRCQQPKISVLLQRLKNTGKQKAEREHSAR